MKILVVGTGSMGRRRLRDLTCLAPGDVALFEPIAARANEAAQMFDVPHFSSFEEALDAGVDTLVVSTPPAFHDRYLRQGIERELNIFAEVPFTLDRSTLEMLISDTDYSAVIGISHTIRYYPPVRIVHDLLAAGQIGKPLYLEYSLGNYLPDWHPHEDYRTFYAQDERLGGAGMDMILHELGAIQWWMGSVQTVTARLEKISLLEVNGPDIHNILLKFDSANGYFHNDIIEQGTLGRHVRIAGDAGTLEWRQDQPFVRLYSGSRCATEQLSFSRASDWEEAKEASKKVRELINRRKSTSGAVPSPNSEEFSYESCYFREMAHFLSSVRSRSTFAVTTREEWDTLRTFEAIRESNEKRHEICVSNGSLAAR